MHVHVWAGFVQMFKLEKIIGPHVFNRINVKIRYEVYVVSQELYNIGERCYDEI